MDVATVRLGSGSDACEDASHTCYNNNKHVQTYIEILQRCREKVMSQRQVSAYKHNIRRHNTS